MKSKEVRDTWQKGCCLNNSGHILLCLLCVEGGNMVVGKWEFWGLKSLRNPIQQKNLISSFAVFSR